MKKVRANCIGLCPIVLFIVLIIFSVAYNTTSYKHGLLSEKKLQKYNETFNATNTDLIIPIQRQKIAEEMENFEYSMVADKLSVLTPESGGKPYRSIIITTWRSGSTFLGEILNAMPGNYYHYEPLLPFVQKQIRGPPHAEKAVRDLKQLLNCNYTGMDDYLSFFKKGKIIYERNPRLFQYCELYPAQCLDPNFLNRFCRLFPLQSMKVIRLRLRLAEELINDKHLNARVVLLIRDPRGTLQSRRFISWCTERDCADAASLCNDLVDDFYAALILSKKYPKKFKAIRYEDLALNAYNMTKEVLDFYGLPYDRKVKEFLETHTISNDGAEFSTFRDSKSAPFHWLKDLIYDEIDEIQGSCAEAMRLWGYQPANETTILEDTFNPLLSFKLF